MGNLWQDLRYALRLQLSDPGFTAIAVLTLALGIGANAAIFSVLNAVLLKSLPVEHPEQLAFLTDPDEQGHWFGSQHGERTFLAYSEFEYLRDHNAVFSTMCAADSELPQTEVTLGEGPKAEKQTARVRLVSGDYFATLGVKPAAGRLFGGEADRTRGGSPVAVVSYAFWSRRFGLSPDALGQTLEIHHTAFEIVGVTPPGFFGETSGAAPDIWVPMLMQSAIYPGQDYLSASRQGVVNIHAWIQVLGRLKPGISIAQANAAVNVNFQQLLESAAGSKLAPEERQRALDQRIRVRPGAQGASALRSDFGKPLQFLMALVGLVLLIACVNVANLLLARGAARQKEFAMRLAVGAGRARLIRQLLTESLLLAAIGGALGIFLANWGDALLLRMVSGASPGAVELNLQPDARMVGFLVGVTALTALLFGLVPSLHTTRVELSPVLKSTLTGVMGEARHSRLPMGKILVIAQVSVSLVLLVAAGLFVRSLEKLGEVNLGYPRENLVLMEVNATAGGYKGQAATRLYEDLLEKIRAIPGLRGATVSANGLFSGHQSGDPVAVEGYTPKAGEEVDTSMDHVGPDYFSTVGIPILMGRQIEAQDSGNGLRAAVVNETFAKMFFPKTNPIGKHVRDTYPGNPADAVVVGVAADAKYNSLREETPPRLYVPLFQPMWEQSRAVFEARTFADPASVSGLLRQAVQSTSASLPPVEIHTMTQLVNDSLQTDRFVERLAEAFGLLAIVLASIGLYGVMAYTVARRTRDIGIRLALGAEPGNVLLAVLRETLVLVLMGIGIGVPLAVAGTRLVRSMLFGLGVADPVAIVSAAALLMAVAALAGFLPARRAARVDPMVALRYE